MSQMCSVFRQALAYVNRPGYPPYFRPSSDNEISTLYERVEQRLRTSMSLMERLTALLDAARGYADYRDSAHAWLPAYLFSSAPGSSFRWWPQTGGRLPGGRAQRSGGAGGRVAGRRARPGGHQHAAAAAPALRASTAAGTASPAAPGGATAGRRRSAGATYVGFRAGIKVCTEPLVNMLSLSSGVNSQRELVQVST